MMKKNVTATAVFLLYITAQGNSTASQFQSIASIQDATRQYIDSEFVGVADYKIKLGKMDQRLKLPVCKKSLQATATRGELKSGRNVVEIHCNSKQQWTVYVSAVIQVYQTVIVAAQPIKRGQILTSNTLHLAKKEISSLRSGFFTQTSNIINKQAKRNINTGSVINQANITEPKLVKRGEHVLIKVNSPNLEISVAGIALMDGKENQKIRIKNKNSQQIIQATVKDKGLVVVYF